VDWDLEGVRRAWEGHETPLEWGRYPVEHDPIRRHCHMVDDGNPRFLERGECPPVMVDYFAAGGAGPGAEPDVLPLVRRIPTPGDRLVNLGHAFEWRRTVQVGERLGARHRVLAIEVRPTRLDPLSVWIRTGTTIVGERQDVVATRLNQIMVHRAPAEAGAGGPAPESRPPEAPRRRDEGGAADAAGGETLAGFSLPLTMTRMVLQVSGTQDFYPVHHDREFARAGGHADVFLNTGFIRAALSRLLTDWMGDAGFLARLGFQMRRPHLLGDTITVRGRVTAHRAEGAQAVADLDVWIENPRDGVATPGRATVHLSPRD
jgi:acyl dehydratase